MGEPVVVQGTAISQPYNPYEHKAAAPANQPVAPPTSSAGAGEQQPAKCRDPIFAFLLIGNVAAIAAVAGIYGSTAFDQQVNNSGGSYDGYVAAAFVLGVIAMVFTGFCLPLMMCIPMILIKASLIGMLILSGAMMVVSFLYGNIWGGIFGVIFFLIFGCYARAVWSRIPFASVNLLTACTAVKKNCGVVFVSYLYVILAFGWSILWTIALAGVYDQVIVTVNNNQQAEENYINYGYYFLLFLSFFFTHQVIQNCTHVTVSGTVGSWWFSPEHSGCCSGGVMGSIIRTLTTSFGSATKAVAQAARGEEGGSFLLCIAECILQCLADLLEYFNKWAFVYVGLYGYSYIEAGKNVFTLFKNRGWEAIIADDLISNVFFFLSLGVGGVCCGIGYAFNENTFGDLFNNTIDTGLSVSTTNAILGFIIGLVLSSILLSTIGSAVNAVIVCFAEGPAEFEANHPELSRKMRETWLQFYPNCGA
eukprot:scaffold1953_cov146-Skeletonema_menzelii.AAC.4